MLLDMLLQHNTFWCYDLSEINIFTTFGHLGCYTLINCCFAIINYIVITILVVKSLPLIYYYLGINSSKWNIRAKGCVQFRTFDTLCKNALQKKKKVSIYTPLAVLKSIFFLQTIDNKCCHALKFWHLDGWDTVAYCYNLYSFD